jgi:CRISPR-associated protein Cas1
MVMSEPLLDRILHFDTLVQAWERVADNAGAGGGDGISIARFGRRLDANLIALIDEVRSGSYRPGPVRLAEILTGAKRRVLTIPPIRDRVLQRAALTVLTPAIDPMFLPSSFGYRPRKSLRDAVRRLEVLRDRGLTWVIDADIRDCFGTIDHELLAGFIRNDIPGPDLQALLVRWIAPPRPNAKHPRQCGIGLGAPISPLCCNLYLHRLDRGLKRDSLQSVRYADDFVVLCKSEAHAGQALRTVEKLLGGLALTLHPEKTRVTTFEDGFDFLGVRFEGTDYRFSVDGTSFVVEEHLPDWFVGEIGSYT